MSTITRESVFILLKVINRHEEKRPDGRTELMKLKRNLSHLNLPLFLGINVGRTGVASSLSRFICSNRTIVDAS